MANSRKYLLLIILLVLAVYSNSFQNKFVWDDEFLIVTNPAIMSWKYAWIHFALDLYRSFSNYYRPIQMLTYMVDFSIWRLEPFGYHLTNVTLHILVSSTLFWLLKLMTEDERVAFMATLFYALHPAHTSAVTYVAGRADPLATLFTLLSLVFFHQHFKTQKDSNSVIFYILSLTSFLLGLLSKEVVIILPALILLYRLFFIKNYEVEKSKRAIKFHYISWFIIILAVYLILRCYALNFQKEEVIISVHPLHARLLTSLKALGIYLTIIFLPLNLYMERDIPYVYSLLQPELYLSVLLFLLFLWLAVRMARLSKAAFFGFIFFSIALLPVMNIYPLMSNMAEHWLYIPLVGISIFLSCLGIKLWDAKKSLRPILMFITACYLVFFSFRAFIRNFDWRDEYTMYMHTLNYSPKSIKMLTNVGNMYHRRGDYDLAVIFHKKAAKINPRAFRTHLNLGLDYEAMGSLDKALAKYKLSAYLNPNYENAYFNMGNIYVKKNKEDMAIYAYKEAIRCDDFHIKAHLYLGNIYFDKGYYEEAKKEYERVIELDPYIPDAYNNLGSAFDKLGLHNEAVARYKKAIELNPQDPEYHKNLGAIYGKLGMYDETIEELKRAYQLKPRDAETLINLGAAYFYKKDIESARKEWDKALFVDPSNTIAIQYLSGISQ